MTAIPNTLDASDVVPLTPDLRHGIDDRGLAAVLAERTNDDWLRIAAVVADPTAADSRASYAAWLRRQAAAWAAVRLPSVHVAALDWPLASVRPQCLDVVGLIVADLREIAPRSRPTIVPVQPTGQLPPHGTVMAAALLCLRVAQQSAPLLPAAEALSRGTTAFGTATRYLARCADLADRAAGLEHEVQEWSVRADASELSGAVTASEIFTARLAAALEAAARTGW